MQQTTTNQSQQTLEQTVELQRNVAKMVLSALQWQDTAQRQGLELTKTILQNYIQGVEAALPQMEKAMEQGMQAGSMGSTFGTGGGEGTRSGQFQGQQGFQGQQPQQGRPTEQGYLQTGEWVQRESIPDQSGRGGHHETSQGRENMSESAHQSDHQHPERRELTISPGDGGKSPEGGQQSPGGGYQGTPTSGRSEDTDRRRQRESMGESGGGYREESERTGDDRERHESDRTDSTLGDDRTDSTEADDGGERDESDETEE